MKFVLHLGLLYIFLEAKINFYFLKMLHSFISNIYYNNKLIISYKLCTVT